MKFEEFTQPRTVVPAAAADTDKAAELLTFAKTEEVVFPEVETYGGEINPLLSLKENLDYCLGLIDDDLMKGYITHLDEMEALPPAESELTKTHFFRINELVYEKDEFLPDKLATVYHALSGTPCSVVLLIHGDGTKNSFFLGTRSRDSKSSSATAKDLLKQGLVGQFPGTRTEDYYEEDITALLNSDRVSSISSVSCIADMRKNRDSVRNNDFIQGIDKFVNSMAGKRFTCVILAESVSNNDLSIIRRGYENIYSQISPFAQTQISFSSNTGRSVSATESGGFSHTVTDGTSRATSDISSTSTGSSHGVSSTKGSSDSHGTSSSVSVGRSRTTGVTDTTTSGYSDTKGVTDTVGTTTTNTVGVNFFKTSGIQVGGGGVGASIGGGSGSSFSHSRSKSRSHSESSSHTDSFSVSHAVSVSDTVSRTMTKGVSNTHSDSQTEGVSDTKSLTESQGHSVSDGVNHSESSAINLMNSIALSESFGDSRGITFNSKNKTLSGLLDRLDKQIQRIDECESIGMWECAAYFLGDGRSITENAANTYLSLMAGNQSGIERSAVNTWTFSAEADADNRNFTAIEQSVRNFCHPRFVCAWDLGFAPVTPSSLVSTRELSLQMGLPKRSVGGLPVSEHAAFGQEVVSNGGVSENGIKLGKVYHMNQSTPMDVILDKNSLAMHTFITGSTGSGKSNTVYKIIDSLRKSGVGILVIEPAKGEYKNVFGDKGFTVLSTNPSVSRLLRIDPFRFPMEIHVLEHIDRLVEIFTVCWPMYAAMPAVLKDAVVRSYEQCGWDLMESTNEFGELYPTFSDVTHNIREIIDSSEYDTENKGAYKGSLITRLQSLCNGINGMIFSGDDISDQELFDGKVIVDLSRVGSSETKSLIMGMLVLKLQEYRMTSGEMNAPLRHVTVLEEAHNLLKRTSTVHSADSADLLGKSVEMLSNAIAEMRTYGEGFIIADQSPGLLDMSVIRNTNTKMILRLPEQSDRELVGKAADLNDDQITELAKLPCGVAAVYQNEWLQPVLCKVERFDSNSGRYSYSPCDDERQIADNSERIGIASLLLNGETVGRQTLLTEIRPKLDMLGVSHVAQAGMLKTLSEDRRELDMVTAAPFMAALFPQARREAEAAYKRSGEPTEWTKRVSAAVDRYTDPQIDRQLYRDIVQAVITDYLYLELHRVEDLKKWAERGGLR